MESHRVSVIVPTYNRRHLIERALNSVLCQTRPAHEVVVVDDGSDDGTDELMAELTRRDSRLVYLKTDRRGASAARNRGVALATGSLIAFQDSDDEWFPTFLQELLPYHDRPNVVAFSSMLSISRDGSKRVDHPNRIRGVPSQLIRSNCISTQTVLADASLMKATPFDESLPRLQDWDAWLGLIGSCQFVHHPKALVVQYLQDDSITAGSATLYVALRTITRKHWRVLIRRPQSFVKLWLAARVHTALRSRSCVPGEEIAG